MSTTNKISPVLKNVFKEAVRNTVAAVFKSCNSAEKTQQIFQNILSDKDLQTFFDTFHPDELTKKHINNLHSLYLTPDDVARVSDIQKNPNQLVAYQEKVSEYAEEAIDLLAQAIVPEKMNIDKTPLSPIEKMPPARKDPLVAPEKHLQEQKTQPSNFRRQTTTMQPERHAPSQTDFIQETQKNKIPQILTRQNILDARISYGEHYYPIPPNTNLLFPNTGDNGALSPFLKPAHIKQASGFRPEEPKSLNQANTDMVQRVAKRHFTDMASSINENGKQSISGIRSGKTINIFQSPSTDKTPKFAINFFNSLNRSRNENGKQ